jgi:hypothetical protein
MPSKKLGSDSVVTDRPDYWQSTDQRVVHADRGAQRSAEISYGGASQPLQVLDVHRLVEQQIVPQSLHRRLVDARVRTQDHQYRVAKQTAHQHEREQADDEQQCDELNQPCADVGCHRALRPTPTSYTNDRSRSRRMRSG